MLHGRRNDMFGDEERKLAAHPIHSQLEEVLAETKPPNSSCTQVDNILPNDILYPAPLKIYLCWFLRVLQGDPTL